MGNSIQVQMIDLICGECGVVHSIPQQRFEASRIYEELPYFCPNGHAACAAPLPRPERLNKNDILAAHELEKAEARNADMARREKRKARRKTKTAE